MSVAAVLAILVVAGESQTPVIATMFGAAGDVVGSVATVERFVGDALSLDVAVAGRLGRIDALDARELATSAATGGAWWPVPSTPDRRWGLGLRLEALLLYHAVSHARTGGTVEWK